jgi:membrane protein
MDPLEWAEQRLRAALGWWRRAIWEDAARTQGWLRRSLRVHVRAWENAVLCYKPDLIHMRANALTYRTLLALVPLLAVAFSLFQAFGGLHASERALRRQIFENLAPGSAALAVEWIEGFAERISAGAIGGIGVVVLFVTAVALLTAIEEAFNALWNVARVRPFLNRFVIYWALVTVGPVLLALSFSLTSAFRSNALLTRLEAWLPGGEGLLAAMGLRALPWLISCSALTLLYLIVPNTRVGVRAALGGGLLAGTLWELAKMGFTWASTSLFRYSAVYGSFAALPVFLIWLQLAWTVVLLGCKVTYGLQYSRALLEERTGLVSGPALREFIAVRSMVEVARAFLRGEGPAGPWTLAETLHVPLEIQKDVVNRLVESGLLLAVPDDGKRPRRPDAPGEGYVPGRDAGTICIRDVLDAIRATGSRPEELHADDPASAWVRDLLQRGGEASSSVTGITLAEAVDRIEERPEPRAAARTGTA